MDIKKIQDELALVLQITEGWKEFGAVELERDMVLGKLAAVYEAVKFPAASVPAIQPQDVPVESFEDEKPAEESAPKDFGAEEDAGDDSSIEDTPTPVIEELPAQEKPAAEPHASKKAAPQSVAGQSLFDVNEVPVTHTVDRRVILSLYGDDDAPDAKPSPVVEQAVETTVTVSVVEELPVIETPAEEQPEEPAIDIDTLVEMAHDALAADEGAPSDDGELPSVEIEPLPELSVEPVAEPVTEAEPEAEPEPELETPVEPEQEQPALAQEKSGKVIGEVVGNGGHVLGDTFANGKLDMATKLAAKGQPLGKSIGLNDRFLMIRDLFAGNAKAYDKAITDLDAIGSFDDALVFIYENYSWDPESDGAKLIVELLERKLL